MKYFLTNRQTYRITINMMTDTDNIRNEYRLILRRSEQTAEVFNAAVLSHLDRMGLYPYPENFIKAAKQVRFTCRRCCGTGAWAKCWDVTDPKNPTPLQGTPSGTCFRCGGIGSQDDADRRRNYGHDTHYMAGAA